MSKTAMVVWNTMLHDASVTKEAQTLARHGHEVCVFCVRTGDMSDLILDHSSLPKMDPNYRGGGRATGIKAGQALRPWHREPRHHPPALHLQSRPPLEDHRHHPEPGDVRLTETSLDSTCSKWSCGDPGHALPTCERPKPMPVDVDGCLFQVGWDEEISDCGEYDDETLERAWRTESLHHPFRHRKVIRRGSQGRERTRPIR